MRCFCVWWTINSSRSLSRSLPVYSPSLVTSKFTSRKRLCWSWPRRVCACRRDSFGNGNGGMHRQLANFVSLDVCLTSSSSFLPLPPASPPPPLPHAPLIYSDFCFLILYGLQIANGGVSQARKRLTIFTTGCCSNISSQFRLPLKVHLRSRGFFSLQFSDKRIFFFVSSSSQVW